MASRRAVIHAGWHQWRAADMTCLGEVLPQGLLPGNLLQLAPLVLADVPFWLLIILLSILAGVACLACLARQNQQLASQALPASTRSICVATGDYYVLSEGATVRSKQRAKMGATGQAMAHSSNWLLSSSDSRSSASWFVLVVGCLNFSDCVSLCFL